MDEHAYDVLGLGAIAVDDLLFVDHYPPAEAKVRVQTRLRQAGGLTGNALVAAARLGARAAYAGLIGDDELSHFVMQVFDREGVDHGASVARSDARPAHSTIIVDQRHHTRTIFSSAEGELGPDAQRPDAAVLRRARVLLIDHHGVEGTRRAAEIARCGGVAVVADMERDPGGRFADVLALVDHLVLSQRFACQMCGSDDPAEACRRLWRDDRQAVVVTCGSAGCWYFDAAGGPVHQPAFPVDVVDTTGCGDVFHGAYCTGLARGMGLAARVRFAAAAAGLKAMHAGGQAGAPTLAAVEQLLARG